MVRDLLVRGKVMNELFIRYLKCHISCSEVYIIEMLCMNDGQWHVGLSTACPYITEVISSRKYVVHIMKFQNMNPIFL